jgi:hypothetical protein
VVGRCVLWRCKAPMAGDNTTHLLSRLAAEVSLHVLRCYCGLALKSAGTWAIHGGAGTGNRPRERNGTPGCRGP